jgi:hypothetical protein
MSLLLKKYITNYLKEAASSAISMGASDITGQSQHRHAASYKNDMTSIDDDEVLLKVLENVGDNCFISFVEDYDENIPRLEISPVVRYDTPHGNYAYPLTVVTLKEIVEKSSIGEATFAIDRPYFHLFKKSNALNSIEIKKDGTSNYSGNLIKDLKTIVHTAVMYSAALFLENDVNPIDATIMSDDEKGYKTFAFKNRIRRKIRANVIDRATDDRSIHRMMSFLIRLYYLNNNAYHHESVNLIVDYLTRQTILNANSRQNRFFKASTGKLKSKFHVLYYTCWMLSNVITQKNTESFEESGSNRGSVFTMLLNSIDIDFIHDKGSKTLHGCEPIQAVYLNSSKKESVSLIGTFNNIFYDPSKSPFELLGSSQNTSKRKKSVTMDKIVNIVSSNARLASLFDTPLFNNPKLEFSIEELREKAWQNLTKKPLKIAKYKQFHSSNKIVKLNMYQQDEHTSNPGLIVFDIGFKKSFQDANVKQQTLMIRDDVKKIVQITDSLDYLQVFLSKYCNKNVYELLGMSALDNMVKTVDNLLNYVASIEIESDEDKELVMSVNLFINYIEDIIQLASIAHKSTFDLFNIQ